MIVCPNCNHSNPDGAQACEACYTPLPNTKICPNCSAPVQSDATFCGQCGSSLQSSQASVPASAPDVYTGIPDLVTPEPLVEPEPLSSQVSSTNPSPSAPAQPVPPTSISAPPSAPSPPLASTKTQLQQQVAKLLHVQTDTTLELPQNLSVIHIGKSNDRIPPDIDVSGFPNSEIVSRIHADIRVEGDAYYIEDVGSSNGTYINNKPLALGDRHRLRVGDRISLGKGDLVSFLFQLA